jgi:hypothetical protein
MSTPTVPEAFVPLNGSAGNSAPVTGGRRHRKHLKVVTRKQARKILSKMGKKMRGGNEDEVAGIVSTTTNEGGRRHRGTKKTHRRGSKHTSRRGRNLFGLKY